MTEEEMNVAIAEACGWKITQISVNEPNDDVTITPPGKDVNAWRDAGLKIPNYCRDLNAMHEAYNANIQGEDDLEDSFTIWLGVICCGDPISNRPNLSDAQIAVVSNASARQRAEAFLRTVGKWQE